MGPGFEDRLNDILGMYSIYAYMKGSGVWKAVKKNISKEEITVFEKVIRFKLIEMNQNISELLEELQNELYQELNDSRPHMRE